MRVREILRPWHRHLKWLRAIARWQAGKRILPYEHRHRFVRWVNLLTQDEELVYWKHQQSNVRFVLDLRDHIQSQIYYFGAYQPHVLDVILCLISPHSLFWDIGAHIGQHTVWAARRYSDLGEKGVSVIAFEPDPQLRSHLCFNLALNDLATLADVHSFAISEMHEEGLAHFFVSSFPNRGNGSLADLRGDFPTAQKGVVISVPTMSLDLFWDRHAAVHKKRVAILKADVEGAELNVLKGGRNLIMNHRPALVFEAHGVWMQKFGYGFQDIQDFLESLNYRLWIVLEERVLKPFNTGLLSPRSNDILSLPVESEEQLAFLLRSGFRVA